MVATSLLGNLGHRTTIVHDGAEAVDAVRDNDYDLVLMDVQMPVMDGIEATHRIRALEDPDKSRITIVALTANAMKGDEENYRAAGMNDYLSKPITRDELQALLDKWLNGTPDPAA